MAFKIIRICGFLLPIILLLSISSLAQESPIILTVQLSEGMEYLSNETIFRDFEAAHPDLALNIIYQPYSDQIYVLPPFDDIEEHLDSVDTFTLQADVLMMTVGEIPWLSIEATRAGYILDLAPLFNADSTADPSVYYPTVWQAAQWDGGLWILPTSTIISTVIYDAKAFDTAGLAYPGEDWRLSDFANAADVLATRSPDGNVTAPGFGSYNASERILFSQFLEQPLYDSSQFPSEPQILRPDTLELANQWLPALSSGAILNFGHDYGERFMVGADTIPLMTGYLSTSYFNNLEFAPLPGGSAVVNIGGFVVSGRTEYPQLAYELASYLAADQRATDAMRRLTGGTSLARPEYAEVERIIHSNVVQPPSEALPLINEALQNGVPGSELLYFPYFQLALFHAAQGEIDIETALRNAEALAISNLELAASRRDEIAGTIPTPVPEIALAPNEIELSVYYQEGDAALWQTFADDFAANDAEVARIVLQSPTFSINFREEGTDCFYYNAYFARTASDYFLDISPLIAADADFLPDDWLTGVFNAVQKDDGIYALPIAVSPFALWYNPDQLEAFGLEVPQTSSELLAALNTLSESGSTALASYPLDTSLLMLLAAYGAVPIYNEAGSIQIDFTSEKNLAVIQQVLDLARSEIIKYGAITDFSGDSMPNLSEPFVLDFLANSLLPDAAYLPVVFPAGSQYTAVNYQVMAGYISRFSQHPEACYRFLTSLSHRPDLLNGFPAQRSEAIRSDYATFYDDFNQQLNAPDLLVIPLYGYYTSYWLFRAFDRYILEEADLLAELSAAEQLTRDYLLCIETGQAEQDCARQVDPTAVDG